MSSTGAASADTRGVHHRGQRRARRAAPASASRSARRRPRRDTVDAESGQLRFGPRVPARRRVGPAAGQHQVLGAARRPASGRRAPPRPPVPPVTRTVPRGVPGLAARCRAARAPAGGASTPSPRDGDLVLVGRPVTAAPAASRDRSSAGSGRSTRPPQRSGCSSAATRPRPQTSACSVVGRGSLGRSPPRRWVTHQSGAGPRASPGPAPGPASRAVPTVSRGVRGRHRRPGPAASAPVTVLGQRGVEPLGLGPAPGDRRRGGAPRPAATASGVGPATAPA